MLGSILFGTGLLICGIVIGWQLKSAAFQSKDWDVLRWNSDVFGFRRVMPGTKIFRDEKVMLACRINTEDIEEDGLIVD
tara:strand:- start:168 stop:404 length:237 start_codon:yes stop_codon:yes gene_type:complete